MAARMTKKVTKAQVRARLAFNGYCEGDILLDGKAIGRFVQYANGSGSSRRLVLASRIVQPVSIVVEASRIQALLDKVAGELATAMSAGSWPVARASAAGGEVAL